jgi:hypothetical protein
MRGRTRDDSSASAYSCQVPFHPPADTTRCPSLNLPDVLFTTVPTPACHNVTRCVIMRCACHGSSIQSRNRLAGPVCLLQR